MCMYVMTNELHIRLAGWALKMILYFVYVSIYGVIKFGRPVPKRPFGLSAVSWTDSVGVKLYMAVDLSPTWSHNCGPKADFLKTWLNWTRDFFIMFYSNWNRVSSIMLSIIWNYVFPLWFTVIETVFLPLCFPLSETMLSHYVLQ